MLEKRNLNRISLDGSRLGRTKLNRSSLNSSIPDRSRIDRSRLESSSFDGTPDGTHHERNSFGSISINRRGLGQNRNGIDRSTIKRCSINRSHINGSIPNWVHPMDEATVAVASLCKLLFIVTKWRSILFDTGICVSLAIGGSGWNIISILIVGFILLRQDHQLLIRCANGICQNCSVCQIYQS